MAKVTVRNAVLTKKASILNSLLTLDGIEGVVRKSKSEYTYDDKYFDYLTTRSNTDNMIFTKKGHEYVRELQLVSSIRLNRTGKIRSARGITVSAKAEKLGYILFIEGNFPITRNHECNEVSYNGEYFNVVDDVLEVKEKYKQQILIK